MQIDYWSVSSLLSHLVIVVGSGVAHKTTCGAQRTVRSNQMKDTKANGKDLGICQLLSPELSKIDFTKNLDLGDYLKEKWGTSTRCIDLAVNERKSCF